MFLGVPQILNCYMGIISVICSICFENCKFGGKMRIFCLFVFPFLPWVTFWPRVSSSNFRWLLLFGSFPSSHFNLFLLSFISTGILPLSWFPLLLLCQHLRQGKEGILWSWALMGFKRLLGHPRYMWLNNTRRKGMQRPVWVDAQFSVLLLKITENYPLL